jgi:hypothetical protein
LNGVTIAVTTRPNLAMRKRLPNAGRLLKCN